MDKIVRAINVMISNRDKISDVMEHPITKELFFLYKNKYVWSIFKKPEDDEITIYFYKDDERLSPLNYLKKLLAKDNFGDVQFMCYRSSEINTREARASFQELYLTVKEKLLGVDEVLDDILHDDDTPF